MSEISNKSLATLLVAAIVVSLAGTLISLNKIGSSSPVISISEGLAGRATTTGTASIEITQTIEVNASRNTVNFGTGVVMSQYSNCTLTSNQDNATNLCSTFDAPGTNNGFILENTGNTRINVTAEWDVAATGLFGTGTSTREFKHLARDKDTTSATFPISTYTDITALSATYIVRNLQPDSSIDEFYYDVLVNVPSDSATGARSAVVTFVPEIA